MDSHVAVSNTPCTIVDRFSFLGVKTRVSAPVPPSAPCGCSVWEVVSPNYVKAEHCAVMQLWPGVWWCVWRERVLHWGHGATSSKTLLQSMRQRLPTLPWNISSAVDLDTVTLTGWLADTLPVMDGKLKLRESSFLFFFFFCTKQFFVFSKCWFCRLSVLAHQITQIILFFLLACG